MKFFVLLLSLVIASTTQAKVTKRLEQLKNSKVCVWETFIYPTEEQKLALHRHDHDRVVVALTAGLLKITNDQGVSHYWKLEKDKAYYLAKDKEGELHSDENVTTQVIRVMVVELR